MVFARLLFSGLVPAFYHKIAWNRTHQRALRQHSNTFLPSILIELLSCHIGVYRYFVSIIGVRTFAAAVDIGILCDESFLVLLLRVICFTHAGVSASQSQIHQKRITTTTCTRTDVRAQRGVQASGRQKGTETVQKKKNT